jgi:hypothetical protein
MAQILKRVDARGAGSRPNKRPKVSLYDSPPSGDVSLEEFEQFALDRMRVRECPSACPRFQPPRSQCVRCDGLLETLEKLLAITCRVRLARFVACSPAETSSRPLTPLSPLPFPAYCSQGN